MRKLLVLIFILSSCSNENTQLEIKHDDINLHVINTVDELWDKLWAEEFVGINDQIVSIGKVCNSYPENGLHFDVFILCKSLLFDFELKYLQDIEVWANDTQAIEDIFTESKEIIELFRKLDYTNENFLDFIEIIHDNLFAQNNFENIIIDLSYLEETIKMISVDGDDFFMARENDILGKLYDTDNNYDKAIYHTKQAIDYYDRHHGEIHEDTLITKITLAKHYFNINKIKEAKSVLNDVISNSEFESFPRIHLLAWSALSQVEVYHGNLSDELVIRKIFFERYFYAVKSLNTWNADIDNIYLEDFALNLDFLDCESSFKSIQEFEEIKKIRETRYGDDFINTAWFDIEMQILKSNMLCAESKNDSNKLQDKMRNKLDRRLDDLYDPYEIYQFAIYLSTLDKSKDVKKLHKKFTIKTQSILFEIFDGIEKEELENPFSQFLTDTIVFPLVFNLDFLDKEIANKNLVYVKKIINYYFSKDNKAEIMTQAYQNLRNEVTSILIEKNYITEAIQYGNLFEDYEQKIKKIEDIKIFRDEKLLNQSKILVNAYEWDSECKKINCDKNINNILNSTNAYSIDPIFLALYLEKNSQVNILDYINNEFLLLDKKNKYLQEEISYSNDKEDYDSGIESILLKSFNDFSSLPAKELKKIQEFIYPELDIKNIQFNLKENSLIVSVTSIPLRDNVLSVILFISKEDIDMKIINDLYENDIANMFSDLNIMSKDVNNLSQIKEVKVLSKKISDKIFNQKLHNLKNKKNIFFTSNFHDAFNPNLLSINDNWIVSNYDIGYFLKWSDFNKKIENTNINNNPKSYIGFGSVDYSGHENFYTKLDETKIELTRSSNFFKKSKNYIGQQVTEKNILLKGKNNSVVHFATHNTSINKYGLSNVPALVISKNSDNDGYLDAFEIQKIDLSNSDVILSACSTLYSRNDRNNFSKLIRAFKISGSRSIMATRWDIESQSAVLVSSSYAENLSNGNYPHESLSKIQRKLILSEKYNHPVFWAAYMTVMN